MTVTIRYVLTRVNLQFVMFSRALQFTLQGLTLSTYFLMEDLPLVCHSEDVTKSIFWYFRFDAESQRLKEELSHERALKEKLNREKDKFSTDNYRLEHELKVS